MFRRKKLIKNYNNNDDDKTENIEIATSKKRYISSQETKQIIEEGQLRLVPKKYV